MLASHGVEVTGIDPAGASLDVARCKPCADQVRWVHGDVTQLPPLQVDLATMTANVAQVFPTRSETRTDIPGVGWVDTWVELIEAGGATLTSNSTLRFRHSEELEQSLAHAGFLLQDVRDAPDRPGRELVLVARRPD